MSIPPWSAVLQPQVVQTHLYNFHTHKYDILCDYYPPTDEGYSDALFGIILFGIILIAIVAVRLFCWGRAAGGVALPRNHRAAHGLLAIQTTGYRDIWTATGTVWTKLSFVLACLVILAWSMKELSSYLAMQCPKMTCIVEWHWHYYSSLPPTKHLRGSSLQLILLQRVQPCKCHCSW